MTGSERRPVATDVDLGSITEDGQIAIVGKWLDCSQFWIQETTIRHTVTGVTLTKGKVSFSYAAKMLVVLMTLG